MIKKKQNRLKTKSFAIRVTEGQYKFIKHDIDENAIKLAEWFEVACSAKTGMTLTEWRKL